METKEYKSDFFDRVEALGEARGRVLGEADALLRVLRSRGVELTSGQEELVASCLDPERLGRWLDRAGTATSADDVFADSDR